MEENEKEMRDIYPSHQDSESPEPGESLAETIEHGLKRQRLYNFLTGLLAGALLVIILVAIGMEYLRRHPRRTPAAVRRNPYVAGHELPPEEQWVLDYRRTAVAENPNVESEQPLSTKWVKTAAYHLIMGEQALQGDNPQAAQQHLEEALSIFPGLQDARRALGAAYLKQQNFKQAVPILEDALKTEPTLDVRVNLSAACIGEGRYDRAEELLLQALQQHPEEAGVHRNLGLLYLQTGEMARAIVHFETYFKLYPSDFELAGQYAELLRSIDRQEDAIRFLETMQGGDDLQIDLMLACTAAEAGDVRRAVRALEQAARHLSPRRTLSEMNRDCFEKIRHLDAFEELTRKLELASVSLTPDKTFLTNKNENEFRD
jgi:tetratricopeptide (TPR) repeat protein